VGLIALVSVLGFAASSPAAAAVHSLRHSRQAATTGPLQLVPAYFEPGGGAWQAMCTSGPAGSTAILNPRNGPAKRQAADYLPAMAYCREHGWHTIGYVFTRYGKRSLKAVEKAIAHYYQWYPGIEGIFLDEMAEASSMKTDSYYAALRAYVHERGGAVVGNPGDTATSDWQLTYVDTVVTFEGNAADYAGYQAPAWVLKAAPGQIANIVFAAGGDTGLEDACARTAGDGAGWLYVTDLAERPNPYAQLPSYWKLETEIC
jgi:hypothetical protein